MCPTKRQLLVVPGRSAQGSSNYYEGHAFEDRVAEVYRLLHYSVEKDHIFSGRQVDLFLSARFGDLLVHRVIECKLGPVRADDIDAFYGKVRLVLREFPLAQGTIVSGVSFSAAVRAHAREVGITLTLFRDLAAQLLDGHAYVQHLKRELETNDRYPLDRYVEPSIGYTATDDAFSAFEVIDHWLRDSEWNQLTLLGDVGTGKSFLSRIIAHRLAVDFLSDPIAHPLPILVDLRNTDREVSLEGLVLTHFARAGISHVSFDTFLYSLAQGHAVLILDGFDEMASRIARDTTTRNFHELARAANGKAKVLLTCRTHYFKSRTEEEEVVLGQAQEYESEAARELYWELIARKGFKIAYLRPFGIKEIETYVRLATDNAKEALKKIRTTYNLLELSQRPMLLEMIVRSLDMLSDTGINKAALYAVFTDVWIHRDGWRDVLSPSSKLGFLTGLARSLWQEEATTIHYRRLTEYVGTELANQIKDSQRLAELDAEIRAASFLTRDDLGHYGLAHKSYGEYFLARHLANELKQGRVECLSIRRLTPEIADFLQEMVAGAFLEALLEGILRQAYQPAISENALICLYTLRRNRSLAHPISSPDRPLRLSILLPQGMRLSGAKLQGVALEGAVMKRAKLKNVDFSGAILTECDLSFADLHGTCFRGAALTGATFRSAAIIGAILAGAQLDSADFTGAKLVRTDLTDTSRLDAKFDGAEITDCAADTVRGGFGPTAIIRGKGGADTSALRDDSTFWPRLVRHMPAFRARVKARSVLFDDASHEDILSNVIVDLASAGNRHYSRQLDDDAFVLFVFSTIDRRVGSNLRRGRFEGGYALSGNEPRNYFDDEGNAADEGYMDVQEMLPRVPVYVGTDAMTQGLLIHDLRRILPRPAARAFIAAALFGYTTAEIAKVEKRSLVNTQRLLREARGIVSSYMHGEGNTQ
jgi:DNA-directed RNA polymerase specialized sigma24 family protein